MKDDSPSSLDDQFYFCRIQGVGLPYNPGQPMGVKRAAGLPALVAYPNPVTTTLIVHTRSKEALQLTNLSGQVVQAVLPEPDGTTHLNVNTLPPGMYLLRQGQATVKVVKE